MTQAHIFYSGTVQGVGFRYTTQQFATEFDLKGWVRNLRDGRVEVVAHGSEENIQQFMRRLEDHFQGYIADKNVELTPGRQVFADFRIVH